MVAVDVVEGTALAALDDMPEVLTYIGYLALLVYLPVPQYGRVELPRFFPKE